MAEQQNKENNRDNGLLALILGAGAFYLLTRRRDGGAGSGNDSGNGAGNGAGGGSGTSAGTDSNLTARDVLNILDRYADSQAVNNDTEAEHYKRLWQEEEERRRQAEEDLRYREFLEEKAQQEEQEEVKEELLTILSDEEIQALDMRDSVDYRHWKGFTVFNPLNRENYKDIYNFADADTALAIHSFTQINAVNYLRFRIQEDCPLSIFYKEQDSLSICYIRTYIEVVNPLDLPLSLSMKMIEMTIGGIKFIPFTSETEPKMEYQGKVDDMGFEVLEPAPWNTYNFLSLYEKSYAGLLDDADVRAEYAGKCFGTSSDWIRDNVEENTESEDIQGQVDILDKNNEIYMSIGSAWLCSDNTLLKSYQNNIASLSGKSINIKMLVKDEGNAVKRVVELNGVFSPRPVIADMLSAYIPTDKVHIERLQTVTPNWFLHNF